MTRNNKIALITGATSGIGAVMLELLAKTDHDVIILARNKGKLNHHIKKIQQINPDVKTQGIVCDLSSFKTAAYEEYQGGKKINEITPFWGGFDPKSNLAKKLTCGTAFLKSQLESEAR